MIGSAVNEPVWPLTFPSSELFNVVFVVTRAARSSIGVSANRKRHLGKLHGQVDDEATRKSDDMQPLALTSHHR